MSIYLVLICSAVLLQQSFVFSASHTLPKNFIKCKKTDPNLNSCLQNAVVDAVGKMKENGSPSLGIFPLDPLTVDEMRISTGFRDSPINLNFHFKNLQIKGMSQMKVTSYDANLKNARLKTVTNSPKITMEADYVADGKVMLLPVTGNGKCKFVLDNLKARSDLIFKPQEKDGRTYWIIQDYDVKFEPEKMKVNFDGLLNGDKRLNDGINNILNQNWEIFLEGIRPQFERAFGDIFKNITGQIFNKVPIDNIFE